MCVPDSLLSVSHTDLVIEQQADFTLGSLFGSALSGGGGSYLLVDGLLVRKWLPHRENLVGDPVFQVVVPTKFRKQVLRKSHVQSGHLGVQRTVDLIRKHFFWPRLKQDVYKYIRTCYACQSTGNTHSCEVGRSVGRPVGQVLAASSVGRHLPAGGHLSRDQYAEWNTRLRDCHCLRMCRHAFSPQRAQSTVAAAWSRAPCF